jgi:hypothetical protein
MKKKLLWLIAAIGKVVVMAYRGSHLIDMAEAELLLILTKTNVVDGILS